MQDTTPPRELHGRKQLGYNLGYFGIFLVNLLIGVFTFQFYVFTVNLNPLLVAIGISLQLLIGGLFSIIFGVIIDNKKPGKFGKRRIFLFYGLPIWFITSILIWTPPWYCPENNSMFWPTAIYFWIVLIANSISMTCMLVAHSSMFPEQSQTQENRKNIAAVGSVLIIIASILAMLFPIIIQSILGDPENVKWWEPSGKIILFFMPLISVSFVIFGTIAVIITYFSVDESFHKELIGEEYEKRSLTETIQKMKEPGKDRKYRKFLMVGFFNQLAGKTIGLVIIPFLTYALLFKGSQFFIYMIASVCCKFAWFYFWKKIYDKNTLIKTYSLCLAVAIIGSAFELLFLIEFLSFEVKIALFFVTYGTVLGSIYAIGLFATPLGSALIDEAAVKKEGFTKDEAVAEISGAYSGLNLFMISMGQAIAPLIVGAILVGSNSENPAILTLCLASSGIFYLASLLFLVSIKLKKNEM